MTLASQSTATPSCCKPSSRFYVPREHSLISRKRTTELAAVFEELSAVPLIADEKAFTLEVQTDEHWQDETLSMLESGCAA